MNLFTALSRNFWSRKSAQRESFLGTLNHGHRQTDQDRYSKYETEFIPVHAVCCFLGIERLVAVKLTGLDWNRAF